MSLDARTAFLVGTAILSPYLLDGLRGVGVPIPVYITAGQSAAIGAFPQIVLGVPTNNPGTDIADTQSFFAKWNALNTAFLAQDGSLSTQLYTNPKWNPTNFAKLTGEQATELARAFLAAADAGAAALTPQTGGFDSASGLGQLATQSTAESYTIKDSDEYKTLQGMLSTSDNWGTADADDAADMVPVILALAIEMDNEGYLASGKPFIPTVSGGLSAASSAVEGFAVGLVGNTLGAAAGLIADTLLSTPGLILLGGLLIYKVAYR